MINTIALPTAQTFIGSEEKTTRKSILEKVAIFGILLGSGLLLASFYTAIPLFVGAVVTALSAYALHYLSDVDSKLSDEAAHGNRCMLNFLLSLGANPNAEPAFSALSRAAESGHLEIVNDLLAADANPNIKNSCNQTPLHIAIGSMQDEIVQTLLEHGSDPTIQTVHISPAGDCFTNANRRQQWFQEESHDTWIGNDKRTREERKVAANRIVELLNAYR